MSKGLWSLKAGWKYIRRSRFLTLTCLFVMTASFLVTLFFTFSLITTNLFLKSLSGKAQITVFFKTQVGEPRILELKSQLENQIFIEKVSYVSQTEALKIYLGQHQNDPSLLESVSSNILPASLEIKTKDLASLEPLASEFKRKEEVDEVVFFKDVVENFRNLNFVFQIVGLALAGLMILISLLTVLLGVGISVKIRADEIETRRLVGATDAQVIWPFLWQGLIYGLASSLISLVVFLLIITGVFILWRPPGASFLSGVGLTGTIFTKDLFGTSGYWPYLLAVWGHLLFGPILGFLSSYFGVKKYLRL